MHCPMAVLCLCLAQKGSSSSSFSGLSAVSFTEGVHLLVSRSPEQLLPYRILKLGIDWGRNGRLIAHACTVVSILGLTFNRNSLPRALNSSWMDKHARILLFANHIIDPIPQCDRSSCLLQVLWSQLNQFLWSQLHQIPNRDLQFVQL